MSKVSGFRAMTLEEDRTDEKRTKVTVSLNDAEEMPKIRELQDILDIPSPSTALKIAAISYLNVIHGTFGAETLKKLISRDRVRMSDYKRAKNKRI